MAKFGETKQEYDPFSDISNSLNALSEPPKKAEQIEPPAELKPRPQREEPTRDSIDRPAPSATRSDRDRPSSSGGAQRATPEPSVDPAVALKVTKRIKTTHQEAIRLEQASLKLGARLGMSVDLSKITRALWEIYLRHEDEILRSMPTDSVPSRRPSNNDPVGLAELDERLAEMIGEGLMMASMRSRRNG